MAAQHPERVQRLQALRELFAAQLPTRVADLCADHAALHEGRGDTLRRQGLMRRAHSLAGSAGSFGYARLGQVALRIELRVQALIEQCVGDIELSRDIEPLLAALVNLAAQSPDGAIEPVLAVAEPSGDEIEGPRLVYVVDDDEAFAQEIALRLQAYGYAAQWYASPAAVEAAIAERTPAAVLLDVDLGAGLRNGPQLAASNVRLLRARVPIVFVSVQEAWQARMAAYRAGAAAYVTKPIDFAGLAERLDRLTGRRIDEPYRVLVLDDVEELAQHYAEVLRSAGLDAVAYSHPCDMLNQLPEFKPELLLMDLHMPECSGIELAGVIRQKPMYDTLPIMFLSSERDPEEQLEALRVGGDEFLEKPILDEHLVAAVAIRAQRFRALNALMVRDGLTGLLNQITIKLRLEELIPLALRRGSALSFAMLDIDHFKRVNDNYGHPTGDRVLRVLARQLLHGLRRSDLVGRFGGEEFAIIFPDTDTAAAAKVLDELRRRFAELPQQRGTDTFFVSFSAGLASVAAHAKVEDLVHAADQALYQAKAAGRNQICVETDAYAAADSVATP